MTDPLADYAKKRNFKVTPEPASGGTPGEGALRYVIQKHWARQLHYDLRLELEGTMKSWAVPKGPSFDPAQKRAAIQVEDHPISYNEFEGEIPAGQYGAGKVIIWDSGYWLPVDDPNVGYRKGKLKFDLYGHKLKGRWTLVRMRNRAKEKQAPWLLIKERDGLERPIDEFDVLEALPDSVASLPPVVLPAAPEPTSEPKEARSKEAPSIKGAKKASLPTSLSPQLATLVETPPSHPEEWQWELKFDGYRMLARVARGKAQLFTRRGIDWTARMPDLAKEVQKLPLRSGWLDGEVLMLDDEGRPDFQALQNAFDGEATQHLVYYLFDVPFAEGRDLRPLPLTQRRNWLRSLVATAASNRIRFSEAFDAPPVDLVAAACQLGFEGVIGKRKAATYASRRSADWIKLKCDYRQEFVIGGFTDPRGSRAGLGSLLLGVHDANGKLQYTGNVGTGFNTRTLTELRERLELLKTRKSPFADPANIPHKAHWVQPTLVAEVSFAEWTNDDRIRHAVFRGLRQDKPAKQIVRETPVELAPLPSTSGRRPRAAKGSSPAQVESLEITNPERVIDPSTGFTKLDLVHHYAQVAPLMMDHLKDRPVSLVRAPDGIRGELFFQKHLNTGRMSGIKELDPALYPDHPALLAVAQPAGLTSGAQMNVLEYHTWNARHDRIDRPDRITFDLDPGQGVPWEQMQEAAHLMQVLLEELNLPAFLKTSGGKGLHVVVPIQRRYEWDDVKSFSQTVVQHLARTIPQRFVAKSGPKNRIGKIFVDYLRNGFGATTVSAWSARARPGMGVSVPVQWSELNQLKSGDHWTVHNVHERLKVGNDPWRAYQRASAALGPAMQRLGYRKTG